VINRDLVGNLGSELRLNGTEHEARGFPKLVVALAEGGIEQLCQDRQQLLFLFRREARAEVLADDVAEFAKGFIEVGIGLFGCCFVGIGGDDLVSFSRQPDLHMNICQFCAQIAQQIIHRFPSSILG